MALVSMPFISIIRPSIQLGLLKALAESHGFPVRTFHLNLELAHGMSQEMYEAISEYGRQFVGDWLFSKEAFGSQAPDRANNFSITLRNRSMLSARKPPAGASILPPFEKKQFLRFSTGRWK